MPPVWEEGRKNPCPGPKDWRSPEGSWCLRVVDAGLLVREGPEGPPLVLQHLVPAVWLWCFLGWQRMAEPREQTARGRKRPEAGGRARDCWRWS